MRPLRLRDLSQPAEGGPPPILSEPMANTLVGIHAAVREALSRSPADDRPVGGPNPKGDIPRRFDIVAEDSARDFLAREVGQGIILSEESGESHFGSGEPRHLFLLDPVDRSPLVPSCGESSGASKKRNPYSPAAVAGPGVARSGSDAPACSRSRRPFSPAS